MHKPQTDARVVVVIVGGGGGVAAVKERHEQEETPMTMAPTAYGVWSTLRSMRPGKGKKKEVKIEST